MRWVNAAFRRAERVDGRILVRILSFSWFQRNVLRERKLHLTSLDSASDEKVKELCMHSITF